ncbi:MAG: hypothetical protein R3C14_32695 [Caldilineaceae bacterium]
MLIERLRKDFLRWLRYARQTGRLAQGQQEVAFAMGGEAGTRLLKILGMPTNCFWQMKKGSSALWVIVSVYGFQNRQPIPEKFTKSAGGPEKVNAR